MIIIAFAKYVYTTISYKHSKLTLECLIKGSGNIENMKQNKNTKFLEHTIDIGKSFELLSVTVGILISIIWRLAWGASAPKRSSFTCIGIESTMRVTTKQWPLGLWPSTPIICFIHRMPIMSLLGLQYIHNIITGCIMALTWPGKSENRSKPLRSSLTRCPLEYSALKIKISKLIPSDYLL